MAASAEDEYEIPLRDQRYFGSGLKRKRVKFVPSSSQEGNVTSLPTTSSKSVAETYLATVLKNRRTDLTQALSQGPSQSPSHEDLKDDQAGSSSHDEGSEAVDTKHCDICHRPITARDSTTRHESSIAHQLCLQHSYPPSHIDRTRKGLSVLQSQGWDPDSRRGLGMGGEGILHPIKAKENPDRAGLGAKAEEVRAVEKPVKLDAGKVRLMEKEGKKKAERLREAFYRNDDVEKYLGSGGETNETLDLGAFKRAKRR